MSDVKEQATAPSKKSSKLPILIAVMVVVLGGGGAGAYAWHARAAAQAAATPQPKPAPSGMVLLDPFVVNLADADAPRFLRVTLRLVVDTAKESTEITEDAVRMTQVRSAILELLTTEQSQKLTTPEGKNELKKQISERTSKVLAPIEVRDVLFSEFVVQF